MIYVIIFLSLLISAFTSVLLLKKKNNKQMSMLTAFCLNTLILLVATWILYNINDEARTFGFGHSGLYLLIIAIPIITWINFLILQFVKDNRKINT
ncbi:hypothetical protein N783_07580 [Pontibacillus marinus BH030004 = DSM 16465]|uniref:Uncharacterized protein n=1 Tax=Pontibacillus marinus BH030004 = DSM 16465 TaxID=1385511 RepID=A0A0A5GE91_9BACI|nr:hypothetical protein N783_07580 [Pontibacillus marinus BH030004 = DSM 16465]